MNPSPSKLDRKLVVAINKRQSNKKKLRVAARKAK
jgi:hypothetical protein